MDWFFTEGSGEPGDQLMITGEDARHITKSLRMAVGETITLCDSQHFEHLCRIDRISNEGVSVTIVTKEECTHEPDVDVTLYFALTKGDKPEFVIEKAVELGASVIVPVLTDRCISRPDKKGAENKLQRYRKIAYQAAMQSRRGIIPEVRPLTDLKSALGNIPSYDKAILFYEGGGQPLRQLISKIDKKIAVFIGPEGGFEESEVNALQNAGAVTATLGKRILRAETAPLTALSAIMLLTGNLE